MKLAFWRSERTDEQALATTKALHNVGSSGGYGMGGWWPWIRESFAGAWQRNVTVDRDLVLSFAAVFSCITLIASDIGKMRIKLMQFTDKGIWVEVNDPKIPFLSVLKKPNRYQTTIKFLESWLISKLTHGNAYILKQRDNRGVVVAMYVLDPCRVKPLISDDGGVYYQLSIDILAQTDDVIVPASEIIHDPMWCLFHPLCGVSPIYACGLAATQGLRIQNNSAKFFENNSNPGGILTAPGAIADDTAARLKNYWDDNFTGANAGKVAVLGDGLKYEPNPYSNSRDSQMIEQLRWTAENVCTAFHMPAYKIGVGPQPSAANSEIRNQDYYSDCLQTLIECVEASLDEGLGLVGTERKYGVELDLHALLRMDTAARYDTNNKAIAGGWLAPNEARRREDLEPVEGGETPYMQQQNYSLAALAARDANDPFAKPEPAPAPQAALPAPKDEALAGELVDEEDTAKEFYETLLRDVSTETRLLALREI